MHSRWKAFGKWSTPILLQWRHNERGGVSNHRGLHCLLNRLFRRRSKKTSKLRVIGLCDGKPSVIGGFPSQRVSNAKIFPFDDVIKFHNGHMPSSLPSVHVRSPQWLALPSKIHVVKSLLVNKDLLAWLLIGWHLWAASQSDARFEKAWLSNMDLNMKISS